MAEKLNFMVFSALFFISSPYPTKLLEEKTEQFKIIRKFIMAFKNAKINGCWQH